jgi:hypothetical protein
MKICCDLLCVLFLRSFHCLTQDRQKSSFLSRLDNEYVVFHFLNISSHLKTKKKKKKKKKKKNSPKSNTLRR